MRTRPRIGGAGLLPKGGRSLVPLRAPRRTLTPSEVAATSAGGTGTTVTTGNIDTRGANLIVVAVNWASAGIAPTLTDSEGNTWVAAGVARTISFLGQRVYYCFNPTTSATHNFTATGNSSSAPTVSVSAFADAPEGVPTYFPGGTASGVTTFGYTYLNSNLIVTAVCTIGTGHTMSGWSSVATDLVGGQHVGAGMSWFTQANASPQSVAWNWTGSGPVVSSVLMFPSWQFERIQNTPILANHNQGGANIGGLQPDAYAAPAYCWDGTRYVVTVSIWNVAAAKWYSAFFTSSNLLALNYVSASLKAPPGTDYIIGNSGIEWFQGKYWWAYNHYLTGPAGVTIANSTDLVNWTITNDPVPGEPSGADPALVFNPDTGKLELSALNASRELVRNTSADGSTWDGWGSPLTGITGPGSFGEVEVYYHGGLAYAVSDITAAGEYRSIAHFVGPLTAPADTYFRALTAEPANAWESVQVFDGCARVFDRGDGRGTVVWLMYAGGDNTSTTDNTDSCLGLAWKAAPAIPTVSHRRRRLLVAGG